MERITVKKLNNLGASQSIIQQKDNISVQIHSNRVFIVSALGTLSVYDLYKTTVIAQANLAQKIQISQKSRFTIAAIDNILAISIEGQNSLFVMDLKSQYPSLERFNCHVRPITCLISYGNYFVTGSEDMTIRLWELNRGKMKKLSLVKNPFALQGFKSTVTCLTTYGGLLISGSKDKSIKVWDKDKLWLSYDFQAGVKQIFPCPDSEQIIVLTSDSRINFVKILTILNKKIKIHGVIQVCWEFGKKVSGCQLNQEFFALGSGENIEFLEVNLIKSIKVQKLFYKNQRQLQISSLAYKGNVLFWAADGHEVSMIKF